ncbi:growth arrest-specific protein 1-like [Callorhinchus milii]|uniref:Growth arrest-specific protein 1-like n=1 Tax=Callorhinchus milii TaxID=7868 RepID=A0A4W3HFP0_CALMI|nr:growth arrest-specific protein 1-like [Callorhinchus milii]|eukprot:gi/632938780/ref/XP_007906365.1/ PREDICTED: growth arrest-specific protein 1-like [Callorhinchus milii]
MIRAIEVVWYILSTVTWLSSGAGGQHVCWQALLRCQEEKECKWAYSQYTTACDSFLKGARKQCPSHCIGALVKLNQTHSGPDLESCDCGQDAQCRRAKRAIEPCMPRRYRADSADATDLGCTEARQRCEEESVCHSAMEDYLSNCGQLFNGRRCTHECRSTIQYLLSIPSGVSLNTCVCDGVERPFCEVVKDNMHKFCSINGQTVFTAGPGPGPDSEENYYYEDYDINKTDLKPERSGEADTRTSGSPGHQHQPRPRRLHTWLLLPPLLVLWFP